MEEIFFFFLIEWEINFTYIHYLLIQEKKKNHPVPLKRIDPQAKQSPTRKH